MQPQQSHQPSQNNTIKPVCTNCGLPGHHYRNCVGPVTSYGIIAFRITDTSWNQASMLANDDTILNGFNESSLEYLLIQRRDSIGFVELIRAKYKLSDLAYINQQIAGTTVSERDALRTKSFDDLWIGLWGNMNISDNRQYKQEYEQAKLKFEMLQKGVESNGKKYTLLSLLDSIETDWDTPEWGFPKGRRNVFETDYQCAIREFEEETGITSSQYRVFENIDPIRETFFGNNKIHYCHVYYLAWIPSNVKLKVTKTNDLMSQEVGNIGWFSIETAFQRIRSTNLEKREILLRTSSLLRNLCPVLVGPVAAVVTAAQNEVGLLNRNRNHESDDEQSPVRGKGHGIGSECSESDDRFGKKGHTPVTGRGTGGRGIYTFGQCTGTGNDESGGERGVESRGSNGVGPGVGPGIGPGVGPGVGSGGDKPGGDRPVGSGVGPGGDKPVGFGPGVQPIELGHEQQWTRVERSKPSRKSYNALSTGTFGFVEN